MSSKHVIAYGFPISEEELSRALGKHLGIDPREPWSWNYYTPAELLEEEGTISVYEQALSHGLLTPIYGPMEVELIILENGDADCICIAATDVLEYDPGHGFTMDPPSSRAGEVLENFAEFLARDELPQFQLHGGVMFIDRGSEE